MRYRMTRKRPHEWVDYRIERRWLCFWLPITSWITQGHAYSIARRIEGATECRVEPCSHE